MSKIIRMIFCITIICYLVMCTGEPVYATMDDNTSTEYIDENYNYVRYYERHINGFGDAKGQITADLSDIDEVKIRYRMFLQRCCSNPNYEKNHYAKLLINGKVVHYSTDVKMVDDILYVEGFNDLEEHIVNVKNYTSKNATIQFTIYIYNAKCMNCGGYVVPQLYSDGIYLYDTRATASNVPQKLNLQTYGQANIGYTFTPDTSRVVWVIQYNGESRFTPLNEGYNRNGLVASSVNSKVLKLSNIPPELNGCKIGALVYGDDSNLPAGTSYPNTPFYTEITVSDSAPPTVEIKKTIDKTTKSVVVEILATDESGLSDKPYSFDGGASFGTDNKANVTASGVYNIAVKDINGNITKKDVVVDGIEIEKANPSSPGKDDTLKDKDTDTGKGKTGSKDTSGTTGSGDGTGGKPGTEGKNLDDSKGGALDKIKDNDKNNEYVSGNSNVGDLIKPIEETKIISDKKNGKSSDGTSTSKDTSLKAKSISDRDSSDAFERIRQNSEDYIISMRETVKEEEKGAEKEEAKIDLKNIDEDEDAKSFSNDNDDEAENYNPQIKKRTGTAFILITAGIILLLIVLAIVLFFGAIVFVKKDTEYSLLSGSEGIKMPVAVLFISFNNNGLSLCFRELLNKYDAVYVRFGALFAHIYENEKISIMTKFKGENKREIAKEIIKREIVVGKKGGKKR